MTTLTVNNKINISGTIKDLYDFIIEYRGQINNYSMINKDGSRWGFQGINSQADLLEALQSLM